MLVLKYAGTDIHLDSTRFPDVVSFRNWLQNQDAGLVKLPAQKGEIWINLQKEIPLLVEVEESTPRRAPRRLNP